MLYELKKHMEKIHEIYEFAEYLKLKTWDAMESVQDDLELYGELKREERELDAEATFDGKVLKIIVKDCLPRRPRVKKSLLKSASLLRQYWAGNITSAIRRLPEPVRFEKAICVIKVITPRNIDWDVDNRAINIIINSLRIAQVIKDDSWDKLSLCIFGGVDKDNPRTEITVMEQPDDPISLLLNGRK